MKRLMVGIVTMHGEPWKVEENFRRMEAYVREAAKRGANLVIAPENVLDGYVACADPNSTEEAMREIAQEVPEGPYIQRARRISEELGIYLIFGFLERVEDRIYNSCVLINPEGEITARYRKVNPLNEKFITPGHELRPFDTPFGRVGFLLCGDRGVPDNFRVLGVQGTQIIFIPMDGGYDPSNLSMLQRRAADNGCAIVIANTHGSGIIRPDGGVIHERYESECISVQRLDLTGFDEARTCAHFGDRRPDLYGPLTRSFESERNWDDDGEPTAYEHEQRENLR
jgi:predicted amidohydrolase